MDGTLLLGHPASWWDAVMLISLAVAACVAFLVAGATTGSVIANKREAASAKSELEKYKADAGKRIADANARALEARAALEKYRTGRSLSDEQKEQLSRVLVASPKGPVIIKPNFLSPEPTRYASQLSAVFNASGFSDVGDRPLDVVSTNFPGLFLVIRDENRRPPQLEGIAKAFEAAKIAFTAHAEPYVPDDQTVVILVGEQP